LGNPSFDVAAYGEGEDSRAIMVELEKAADHFYSAASREREMLPRRLATLIWNWSQETAHLSSVPKRISHPFYREIIGLGPDAVPLLLQRLRESPDHPEFLFPALAAIMGVDPVVPGHEGNLPNMAEDWIKWGIEEGQIEPT
jgi:hypothetical protein